MAPRRATPKVSVAEAAVAAAAPSTPRAKRSKTAAATATTWAVEEEANNSTHVASLEVTPRTPRHPSATTNPWVHPQEPWG